MRCVDVQRSYQLPTGMQGTTDYEWWGESEGESCRTKDLRDGFCSQPGTYFFRVRGQGCIFLERERDGRGVGDFEQGEADDRHGDRRGVLLD
jgi:hypothetical protein